MWIFYILDVLSIHKSKAGRGSNTVVVLTYACIVGFYNILDICAIYTSKA